MEDRHKALRELPFAALAQVLDFDLSKFRQRKNGTEWTGPCPIHRPKKNSSSFSFAQDGRYQCFSCSAKGRGAIDLTMAVKKCGFADATALLEAASQSLPRPTAEGPTQPQQQSNLQASENPAFKSTYSKFRTESPWLTERGLTPETLDRYEVFQYHNPTRRSQLDGSVLLKISRWSDGECVGYLSRNIGECTPEKPKYRFPANLHKSLEVFGAFQLKGSERLRIVYVVESPFCVMKFHQLGVPAVSPFGWTVSPQQADVIRQLAKGVVFLPDRDKRKEATQYAGLLSEFVWVKMPEFETEDPESLTEAQIRSLA
jgi:DNA primase